MLHAIAIAMNYFFAVIIFALGVCYAIATAVAAIVLSWPLLEWLFDDKEPHR